MTDTYSSQFTPDETFEVPASEQRINVGSPLDVLKQAVAADIAVPDLVLRLPSRPAIKLSYAVSIDGDKFQLWQRRAARKGTGSGANNDIDVLKLSCIVLANQLSNVLVDYKGRDTVVNGEDGSPLNFTHPDFRSMILGGDVNKSIGATQLVRDLYANDGHLIAHAREVIEAAGYGQEVDEFEDDPTVV